MTRLGDMLLLIFIVSALVLAQAGCGSARRAEPLVGPIELSTPQLQRGQQVFMQHCYQCHPGGRAGLGPAINNKPLPAPLIKSQVRLGLGAMPAFGEQHISEKELEAVTEYLAALRQAGKS